MNIPGRLTCHGKASTSLFSLDLLASWNSLIWVHIYILVDMHFMSSTSLTWFSSFVDDHHQCFQIVLLNLVVRLLIRRLVTISRRSARLVEASRSHSHKVPGSIGSRYGVEGRGSTFEKSVVRRGYTPLERRPKNWYVTQYHLGRWPGSIWVDDPVRSKSRGSYL